MNCDLFLVVVKVKMFLVWVTVSEPFADLIHSDTKNKYESQVL